MSKISDYIFVAMTGEIGTWGNQAEDETRPGVDGHTLRLLGRRGEHFALSTRSHHEDSASATQAIANYEALQGTFVDIEDVSGIPYGNVFVHQVKCESPKRMLLSSDDGKYYINTHWTLQRTNG